MRPVLQIRKLRSNIGLLLIQIIALLLLPVMRLALSKLGYKKISWFLVKFSPSPIKRPALNWEYYRAKLFANRVNHVASYPIINASCLERSLLLWWLLRLQRIATELRIGVQFNQEGKIIGHAWLEHYGVVVNDVHNIGAHYSLSQANALAPETIIYQKTAAI